PGVTPRKALKPSSKCHEVKLIKIRKAHLKISKLKEKYTQGGGSSAIGVVLRPHPPLRGHLAQWERVAQGRGEGLRSASLRSRGERSRLLESCARPVSERRESEPLRSYE